MAGAKYLLKTPSNLQSSGMSEISESTDTEGLSTDSTLGTTVTTCKKVLCNNNLPESTEYWLHNEKVLSRICVMEDNSDNGCTTVCFANMDRYKGDQRDASWLKKLAFVSPVLPKLMDSLSMHQLKENEILIHSGLESPRSCPSDSTFEHISSQNQCAGVCLVQYGGKQQPTSPCSMVFEVNKFLIGLELCQERQTCNHLVGHRVEDDTNRSLSSIEDDFLTASEYFDSEEDALRNEAESTDVAVKEKGGRLRHHKAHISKQERSNDSEVTIQTSFKMLPGSFSSGMQQRPSCKAQSERTSCKVQSERTFCKAQSESTGHYAINLAESVLQDAFICLSQDEATNATHADSSMYEGTHPVPEEIPRPPTYSFELPKIVIVQSPDNQEEVSEWSETSPLPILSEHMSASAPSEHMPQACGFFSSGHPPRSVELALACAANVIGTISSPQVTEQLSLEPRLGDMGVEQKHDVEYSFSSALCGMVQVAGAIAIVDLAEDAGELGKKVDPGICCPSIGLISTTEAPSAVTFQHSVAEGTSIKASCANIAEILLKEAFAVLSQPEDQSVTDFLESTHDKIVNGISHPKLSCSDEREAQEFAHVIAEGIFKHAWQKTIGKKKPEGSDTALFPTTHSFLYEYVNNLLFDVLCITSKKFTDILTTNNVSGDRPGDEVKKFDNADIRKNKELLSRIHHLAQTIQPDTSEKQNNLVQGTNIRSGVTEGKYMKKKEAEQISDSTNSNSVQAKDQTIADQMNEISLSVIESSLLQSELGQQNSTKENKKIFSLEVKQSSSDVSINNGITANTEIHKARVLRDGEHKSFSLITQLTPQHSLSFGGSALVTKKDAETRSTMSCFADDLATTVVSMATELAAICLENSSGKQPWFCSLQTRSREGPESYLLPCRTARRKEAQCSAVVTKKHRPPRLSEIKRKTEEQPELMERLVNRVVDESGISDEPTDPFAKFASEVTAKIMNCSELGLMDTSKPGQPRTRLQCTAMERWSRGKASSYESIPEEDTDTNNLAHTLGLGSRLGQNLSRGSSISKQSSCESITDEFSRFMVNQMENEGRGFELLLDYYAGKNATSILNAAMQQVVTKKNGHLNVRSTCLSKQSSTESITEEFYRFMLKDIDKESKDYTLSKTREWNNSLLPPSHRTPLCFRQSSMPDRRSSDSRLTVNSPVKANSFDGFARNSHGDSLNIFPANTVSAMVLCKSDSCLYQKGKTDQITDMLIHETWSNSIESLMRKNKIIMNPEDSVDLEISADLQPQVELFANRLAADIVESGKSVLGSQSKNLPGQQSRPVGERRRGFKQSRPCWSNNNYQDQQASTKGNDINASSLPQQSRKVPLIHIEGDLKETVSEETKNIRELPRKNCPLKCTEFAKHSSENERAGVSTGCEQEQLPLSASSEESTGSWSHIATDDDPHEETSSYIQLSDGNGNSSASSLGIADLEAFSDTPLPNTLVSATAEKESRKSGQDNVDEGTSGHSIGGSSSHREMLVMNFDLEPDFMDSEMQAALQWIAASELGIATIYFKKSQVKRREKFLEVVQLVTQKSWRVGDLFHAMVQFCKLQEENRDFVSSLFDWLLATK
ncbi:A-kinase anchor protein SPHKAP isoform X3 [Brienomyrus brachyistius]|uniref:A-kinase anchor protein SPHKAP isoform X3 n=1 Tax=Brienomyrus brachyistius TaxID=42636 RepID=UPI0020B2256D|nr:A-kinase anchor protein SPHKAP isoform X3 [Brienomyrus brachyistius]